MASILTLRNPKPSEKRAGFCLLLLEPKDGKRKAKVHKCPELDEINRAYKQGALNLAEASALARDLRDREARRLFGNKQKPITLAENRKLLADYWDRDYQFRDVVAPEMMRYDLERALGFIGTLSLYTCTQGELVAKLNKEGLKSNSRRRVVLRLNQLLKFAKRDFTLKMPRQEFLEIKYLNLDEARELGVHLGGIDGHLVILAFSTGCRLGELYALRDASLLAPKGKYAELLIDSQIRKDGTRALPKNRKPRTTKVLPYANEALKAWLSTAERPPRNRPYNEIVKNACKRLWKEKPHKHITFHDLRHSFALEMRRLGESVSSVANLLGNAVQVCETYYTGHGMADESLEALDERLSRIFS